MAVHPMREEAVREYLDRAKADPSLLDHLVDAGRIVALVHRGRRFFRLPARHR
jgi:hypothetical protein